MLPLVANCSPKNIQKTLDEMEAEATAAHSRKRSANLNLVVLLDSGSWPNDGEELVSLLVRLHPGRLIVIVSNDKTEDIQVEVRLAPSGESAGVAVHSEVLIVSCPKTKEAALGNIIRANLLVGVPTELLVRYADSTFGFALPLLRECDSVFFDSARFANLDVVTQFLDSSASLIDLQWLRISSWRDLISLVTQQFPGVVQPRNIRSISLSYVVANKGGSDSDILLLAGWLADRLDLEIRRVSAAEYVGNSRGNKHPSEIKIRFNSLSQAHGSGDKPMWTGLSDLCLDFSDNSKICVGRKGETYLECLIHRQGSEAIHISRPYLSGLASQLLERYFLVGESTINYRSSAMCALKFSSSHAR